MPMLFWCFIATFFLFKLKMKEEMKLFALFCLSVFPSHLIPLPLRMTSTMYYLFYFYLAFYIWNRQESLMKRVSKGSLIVGSLLFLIVFISLTLLLRDNVLQQYLPDIIRSLMGKFGRIIYATLGVLLWYMSTMYIVKRKWHVPTWLIESNVLCMGVYLFQQFILKIFYYRLPMPEFLGTYWLPWIGFFIALFLSVLLTYLLRKLQFGRLLLGYMCVVLMIYLL